MLLTEYDEVKHYERVYRDAHREGEEEGMAKGKAEGIVNMMQALKLSFEQAASIMKIPDEEFPLYKKLIAGMSQDSGARRMERSDIDERKGAYRQRDVRLDEHLVADSAESRAYFVCGKIARQ